MRLRASLAVLALIVIGCPAGAAPTRSALYGNVHYIEEADDTVGIELRVHAGPRPSVDFLLCEGECAQQVHLPIVPVPGGFSFDYRETGADPDGRPVQHVLHFIATYRGRNLIVRVGEGSPEKLRPLRKAIALR
jgi:hypothetical protein